MNIGKILKVALLLLLVALLACGCGSKKTASEGNDGAAGSGARPAADTQ